jgi:hypothetical protein
VYRFVLCVSVIGIFSAPSIAQVQPGSTGGSIGKTEKSISGGESAEPPAPTKSRSKSQPQVDRDASDQSSEASVAGRWRWIADCDGGGRWEGEFDLTRTSQGNIGGSFAGTSWHDIGTITGHISGSSITFTRKNPVTTQYWTGRLAGGRIKGSSSGNANCRWEATRK